MRKKQQVFEALCAWIELCDDQLYSLDDLREKMQEMVCGDEESVYSKKQLKHKLIERYGDHVVFAEVASKRNVICFRNMASVILNEKWYSDRKTAIEDESECIVVAAAKLVKAEIRELVQNMDCYPTSTQFADVDRGRQWVPALQMPSWRMLSVIS